MAPDESSLTMTALPSGVALAHGVDPEELVIKVAALRVIEEVEEVEAPEAVFAPEALPQLGRKTGGRP